MVKKIAFLIVIIFLFSCEKKELIYKINFAFYETNEGKMVLDKLIENFENKFPDIIINKINLTKEKIINPFFLHENKVDIIRIDSELLCKLQQNNTIVSLNNIFKPSDITNFNKEAIASVTIKNNILGIPDNFGKHLLVYYHKNILRKSPKSFERLLKQKKSFILPVSFDITEAYYYTPFYLTLSNKSFLYDSPTIEFDILETSLKIFGYTKIIKSYYLLKHNHNYSNQKELFVQNKIAAFIDGEWEFSFYKNSIDDLAIASSLTINGNRFSSFASTKCFGIVNGKRKDKKFDNYKKFIRFMTSLQAQKKWLKIKRLPSFNFDKNLTLIQKDKLLYSSYQSLLNAKGKPCNRIITDFCFFLTPRLLHYNNNTISKYSLADMMIRYLSK